MPFQNITAKSCEEIGMRRIFLYESNCLVSCKCPEDTESLSISQVESFDLCTLF